MKMTTCLLTLCYLLNTTHAQQAPATLPKTADQRAAYQGPKVVKDSKALGKKMMQKSKPTDGIRTSVRELPVRK